ncbi:MAG: 50S ribosomal protein L4 [Formosimonas sp.]
MDIKLLTGGSVAASDAVFGREYNEALIHQIVVAYQANARQGDRAQKTRRQVKHSTKKPWAQKGTGRARAGMTSSPVWRGGGRAHPNSPDENFSQKVNRKMQRAAMSSIYSQLVRDDRLVVVEDFKLDSPKTKVAADKLKALGLTSTLIITDDYSENLYLATRNLINVEVLEPKHVDPMSLLYYKKVVVTKAAVAQIEEILS